MTEGCFARAFHYKNNKIRSEKGNLRYEYFFPMNDPETVLLIDAWESQDAIDVHHASPMMQTIVSLREKYDLHMSVERYISEDTPDSENRFSMNIHSGQKCHV